MDDIKNLWNELKSPDAVTMDSEQLIAAIRSESKGEIEKLNSKLKQKNLYIWAFIVLFGAFMFKATNLVSIVLLGLLILIYLIGGILLVKERKLLKQGVDLSGNLYKTIQFHHSRINRILKYEEATALVLYPISTAAGFIGGMSVYGDVAGFFDNWKGWVILIVMILLITPLSHALGKWMNNKAFNRYLNTLQKNLEQIETIEQ